MCVYVCVCVCTQDFTEVERAHTTYLHAVAAQCFLTTKTMSLIITSVFRCA